MRYRSRIVTTSAGGTSLARSSAWRGFAPPLPPTKMFQPFSVAIKPKLKSMLADRRIERWGQNILFALSFSTLSHTTTHTTLDLMRSSNTLVSLLQTNGHTNTVTQTESTPCRTNATLDGSQRLSISMTGLHTTSNKLAPDVEKVLLLGTKQVDTLTTCDLGVEVVLLGNLANDHKLVRSNLTTGYTRDNRVGTVSLDVTQEAIIGLLETV